MPKNAEFLDCVRLALYSATPDFGDQTAEASADAC
jgi:hypothetical protein